MNNNIGVVGRKLGMTQVFTEDGTVIPCTVIESKPVVLAKRTMEKDGYDALVLGIGQRKEKSTTKPMAGFFKKANVAPAQVVREVRCTAEVAAGYEIGQELKLDALFEEGQFVDVRGTTKGRGFTGVMKRWGFRGSGASHGAHEYMRHGGSIGTNMTPGRVMPGRKMPGHHGASRNTVLSQRVIKIVPDEGLLLIRGGVPGSKNGVVFVNGAIKKKNGGKPAS
jgi:large subunit ribosomal protein L3